MKAALSRETHMGFKTFCATSIGFIGISAVGLASAGVLTEYGSLANWTAAVSNVSDHQIAQVPGGAGYGSSTEVFGSAPVTLGPGVFTGDTGSGAIYNDGAYGRGIQYFSDDPSAFGERNVDGSVTVAFGAGEDISALAFDLGAALESSDIDISVNGSALAPVAVSSTFPTSFLGVTDTKGPITSITFTETNSKLGEMDVVNGYATASAQPTAAPEISASSAPIAITFLLGLLALLRSRRTAKMPGDRRG
jgi:hypothetical protein